MNIPHPPADLADQVAEKADKLAHAVGDIADQIAVQDLKERAESGAADLLDAATDDHGRPRKGVLIGFAVVLGLALVARRLLR